MKNKRGKGARGPGGGVTSNASRQPVERGGNLHVNGRSCGRHFPIVGVCLRRGGYVDVRRSKQRPELVLGQRSERGLLSAVFSGRVCPAGAGQGAFSDAGEWRGELAFCLVGQGMSMVINVGICLFESFGVSPFVHPFLVDIVSFRE